MHPNEWEELRKYQRGSAQILNYNTKTNNDNDLTTMQTYYGSKVTSVSVTPTIATKYHQKEDNPFPVS